MLEEYLVRFCSPTLACLKTASLFCIHHCDGNELNDAVRKWNHLLNPSGLYVMILCHKQDHSLVYVFRRSSLLSVLSDPETADFLEAQGYHRCSSVLGWLCLLKQRLQKCASCTFPHEIGIFLGYPLEDVKGFMEDKGKNCKACGDWKVYGDVRKAESVFARNQRCTDLYVQLYASHQKTITQLAVAG